MADAVNTDVVFNGPNDYHVRFTNISDGTGEAAVTKVDISTLTGPDGVNAPSALVVEEINWDVQGFAKAVLYWDADTDTVLAALSGQGSRSYKESGGLQDDAGTGATGDVKLTVPASATTGSYDIFIKFRKKA